MMLFLLLLFMLVVPLPLMLLVLTLLLLPQHSVRRCHENGSIPPDEATQLKVP